MSTSPSTINTCSIFFSMWPNVKQVHRRDGLQQTETSVSEDQTLCGACIFEITNINHQHIYFFLLTSDYFHSFVFIHPALAVVSTYFQRKYICQCIYMEEETKIHNFLIFLSLQYFTLHFKMLKLSLCILKKKINKISDSKRAQMNENHLLHLGRTNSFFN